MKYINNYANKHDVVVTVFTAACCWTSSHCIPTQNFDRVSGVKSETFTVGVDCNKGVCCHHSSS